MSFKNINLGMRHHQLPPVPWRLLATWLTSWSSSSLFFPPANHQLGRQTSQLMPTNHKQSRDVKPRGGHHGAAVSYFSRQPITSQDARPVTWWRQSEAFILGALPWLLSYSQFYKSPSATYFCCHPVRTLHVKSAYPHLWPLRNVQFCCILVQLLKLVF